MSDSLLVREVALVYRGRGRRVATDVTRNPGAAWAFLLPLVRGATRERFLVLALGARNQPLGHYEVSAGTLDQSLVHPREVFAPALHLLAARIIIAHNHPSGDAAPSAEDRAVTSRLARCGAILGVRVLDSLVLTDTGWYSFHEEEPHTLEAGDLPR